MPEPPRITIPKLSRTMSPAHDAPPVRPAIGRTATMDGSMRSHREMSPAPRISRLPTEPTSVIANRANLRPVRAQTNTFADDYEEEYAASSSHTRRSRSPPSPANSSQGSALSRAASWTAPELAERTGKKAPPPPPPSRAKKPPPPPPMKRSALSASETSHY
ncbi:hypothetical protein P154DRAFT_339671 [Amniculicola lignicola CBS 123094]|uniref:Uncharacterized protein n=1 Tax=Amniculicola lignicola CBS 123094 TaxID=1392246 RepID=A0A6A5WXN9_9PLEO|nr:hypothetical protein P154DRAFT_339671 [Amniculicola lignicola CBS 123094]